MLPQPFLPQSTERANRYQSDREKITIGLSQEIATFWLKREKITIGLSQEIATFWLDREKITIGLSQEIANRYPTSTRLAAVARETPTYSLRKQNMGESVSSSLTTPGRVSPCTLA